jgi:hypothetical protein
MNYGVLENNLLLSNGPLAQGRANRVHHEKARLGQKIEKTSLLG